LAYIVLASFLPLASWNGVRHWDVILGIFGSSVVLGLFALRFVVRPRISFFVLMVYALGNAGLIFLLTRAMSPWTFVPAIMCIIIMSMMAYPAFSMRPWIMIVIMVVGFSAVVGLELRGVIAPGWGIRDGE